MGPDQQYHTITSLPELRPGDVVNIHPGTYHEVRRWRANGTSEAPITIQGVGATRPVFDGTGQNVSGKFGAPRAIWQIEGNYYIIKNIEFKNARNGNNGAGIRVTGAYSTIISNVKITHCDMGIMSNDNDKLVVENSEIAYNGTPHFNGYSHNFYLNGNRSTIQYCYIHDALYGQNFKTRGHFTKLLYNYIADSNEGEVGAVDSSETESPNSNMVMIGNIIVSKPDRTGNGNKFIDFGQDLGRKHNGTLYAFNNTFIAGSPSIQFLWASAPDASIVAKNNIFYGSNTITLAKYFSQVHGSNNWVADTARVPSGFRNTTQGRNPGFVNTLVRDYYLTPKSECRNIGATTLTYYDANGKASSGTPTREYVRQMKSVARVSDGSLDTGAYEYGTSLPNEPPFLYAGKDQTVSMSTGASLHGQATDDGLPKPPGNVTVTWGLLRGPGTVTYDNPHSLKTAAKFSKPGVYVLSLTGSDGVLSAFREVKITVTP